MQKHSYVDGYWLSLVFLVKPEHMRTIFTLSWCNTRALWNFYFSTQNYAPLGIWACVNRRKTNLRSDFVWNPHKLTENCVKTRPIYKGNGHYFCEKLVLALTLYQLQRTEFSKICHWLKLWAKQICHQNNGRFLCILSSFWSKFQSICGASKPPKPS